MDTNVNPDPANGNTVPNVGTAEAKPKPRGKRATLAAAVVSAGLTLFGLGLTAAGTAQADEPGQEQQAPPPDDPGQPPAPHHDSGCEACGRILQHTERDHARRIGR